MQDMSHTFKLTNTENPVFKQKVLTKQLLRTKPKVE